MVIDPQKKLAGLLVPTFALRSGFDLGIGDTQDMREAIDFCHQHGLGVLQILPINETGGDNSPYNAISSVALDPVLLSMTPETVPGLSQELLAQLAPPALLDKLRQGPVDYPAVKQLKQNLLQESFIRFEKQQAEKETAQGKSFTEFQTVHKSWLPAYTLFRTLMQEHQGNACWSQWEAQVQSPEAADAWIISSPDKERLLSYRRFCAFVQWIAFSQWQDVKTYAEEKSVQIMGDIPFGVSRYSADVWAQPELFDLQWSGGAPPEQFFQTDLFIQKWGQNWGIPLYQWPEHRKQNFAWWQHRVERLSDFFHSFRIDHVLGFFRVYAFPWLPERNSEFVDLSPAQASAVTGGRLPQFLPHPDAPANLAEMNCQQGREILQVILKAAGSMSVVAEDLGVVPDYVRPLLKELGIPGFYIPLFERNKEDQSFKARDIMPPLSLGTYGTHDHAPLLAFYEDLVNRWHGPDGHEAWLEMQRLMRFLCLDENHPPKHWTESLHQSFFRCLLDSPCWLAMFMITDVLGTQQRFNQPGSSSESNWSQRLDSPLHAFADNKEFGPRIKMLQQSIADSHRLPAVANEPASSVSAGAS